MRSKKVFYLLGIVMLLAVACVKAPVLNLEPSTEQRVAPGTSLTFNASRAVVSGDKGLANFEFEVTKPDGILDSDYGVYSAKGEFGIFKYEFKNVGAYTVKVTVGAGERKLKEKNTDVAVVNVIVDDVMASAEWTPGFFQEYENQPITFAASGFDTATVVQYEWLILDPNLAEEESIFQSKIITIGEGVTGPSFVLGSGLPALTGVKKEYLVKLNVVDKFGNKSELPGLKILKILSKADPSANFIITDLPESGQIYENQPITIDGSSSKADLADTTSTTISKYEWLIKKGGKPLDVTINRLADSAPFQYSFDSPGNYTLQLYVENSLGSWNIGKEQTVLVLENKPVVDSCAFIEAKTHYEGEEYSLTIVAHSAYDVKGKIKSIKISYPDKPEDDALYGYSPAIDTSSGVSVKWKSPLVGDVKSKIFNASVYVINESGRVSLPISFRPEARSNSPIIKFYDFREKIFSNELITYDLTPSYGNKGGFTSLQLEFMDITDPVNPHLAILIDSLSQPLLNPVNMLDLDSSPIVLDIKLDGTGDKIYKMTCTATNPSRPASVIKYITSSDAKLIATFTMDPEPDEENIRIYEKQTIKLNARGSMDINKNPVASYAWTILKKVGADFIEDTAVPPQTLPIGSGGLYDITIKRPGVYKLGLKVTAAAGGTATVEKVFNVESDNPKLSVAITPKEVDYTTLDPLTFDGKYSFTGTADFPKPTSAVTYLWYVDEFPDGVNVQPKNTVNSNNFDYTFYSGSHIVYFVATNDSGIGSIEALSFNAFDIEPPRVSANFIDGSVFTNDRTPTWNIAATSDIQQLRYWVKKGTAVAPASVSDWKVIPKASSITLSDIEALSEDKAYIVYVQACDGVNWPKFNDMKPTYTGKFNFTLDTVKPDAPVFTADIPEFYGADAKPTWKWTIPADAVVSKFKLDAEPEANATGTSVTQYTPLVALVAPGEEKFNVLYVQVSDAAGNWSTSASKSIWVDRAGPKAPSCAPVNSITNDPTPDFTFFGPANDRISEYRIKVNGDPDWTTVFNVSSLPVGIISYDAISMIYTYTRPAGSQLSDGDSLFTIQAKDNVGNWGEQEGQCSVTIDTVVPSKSDIAISGQPKTNNDKPLFSWLVTTTGKNAIVETRYRLETKNGDAVYPPDATSWLTPEFMGTGTYNYTVPTSLLPNRTYILYVSGKDAAGNWNSIITAKSLEFTIDKVAPVITLLGSYPDNKNVRLVYPATYNEPGADIQDNSDGLIAWDSNFVTGTVANAPGSYVRTYTVKDAAGNPAVVTRNVLILPPVIHTAPASLTIGKKTYVELNNAETYTLLDGSAAITRFAGNSFGGPLVYTWTVTGVDTFLDTSIDATNSQIITLKAAGVVNMKVRVEYSDYRGAAYDDISVENAASFTVYPDLVVTNGNFENSADNVAPWKWDLDYEYKMAGTWRAAWTSAPQNTSDNYGWANDNLCGLSVTGGISNSKCAKEYDTGSSSGANEIGEFSGTLRSDSINVTKDIPYRVKAWIKTGPTTSGRPQVCNLQIEGTILSSNPLKATAVTAKGWVETSIEFTPTSNGSITIAFMRGTDWGNKVDGEILFDNVVLEYAQ